MKTSIFDKIEKISLFVIFISLFHIIIMLVSYRNIPNETPTIDKLSKGEWVEVSEYVDDYGLLDRQDYDCFIRYKGDFTEILLIEKDGNDVYLVYRDEGITYSIDIEYDDIAETLEGK